MAKNKAKARSSSCADLSTSQRSNQSHKVGKKTRAQLTGPRRRTSQTSSSSCSTIRPGSAPRRLVKRDLHTPHSNTSSSRDFHHAYDVHTCKPNLHLDPPELSPGCKPTKEDELRIMLSTDCPGCAGETVNARTQAAEDLAMLEDWHDHVTNHLPEIEERLRDQQRLLISLVCDQLFNESSGVVDAQLADILRVHMKRTERARRACLKDLASAEDVQRKMRREWGQACEDMFGPPLLLPKKAKVLPKARITLAIRPDRRFYSCQGRWIHGTRWYLRTPLLELP